MKIKVARVITLVMFLFLAIGWISEYYFKIADKPFFGRVLLCFMFCIFMFSILSRGFISRKLFLCLIIISSLCRISFSINFRNLDDLFAYDDHPKYYSTTVENKDLLLKHGTPFGFNHNFQGGIPTVYFSSCFLELIPFSFIFGDRLGYQVMLIFFICLIPLSIFLLTFELTRDEDIAKLISFVSIFPLGLKGPLIYGMTPVIVSMPLSFLSIYFFLKYFYNKKYCLFPLLLFSGLLGYTHPVVFATTWMFFVMIFTDKLIRQKEYLSNFKKFIYFGLFNFLLCLPLCYNLLNYASFFTVILGCAKGKTLLSYISPLFINLKQEIVLKNILFSSTLFLIVFYGNVSDLRKKLILRGAVISSVIILILCSPNKLIPALDTPIVEIRWLFVPYMALFNLSLFLLLKINKKVKAVGIIIVLFIILSEYPSGGWHLITIKTISDIDNKINAFISPGDYVLFENCGHIAPAAPEKECTNCTHEYSHWLTYLQKDLGIKFFSHMGNDPHPYNNFRHMYIVNGVYKNEPLSMESEEEFIAFINDWSVNKACVWSPIAKKFFGKNKYFKLLGASEKYTCYIATYAILPEVRLSKAGLGKITEEGPFSFIVHLDNVSESQTVTINKNYFNFWSAYNEKGGRITLRECNQKICFDIASDGYIYFKYKKNILLNLISVLTLFFSLILDFLRSRLLK